MKGFEFVNYFQKVPLVKQMFMNVFSIDQIPKVIPLRHFLICNLSESHKPGTHWIVFVKSDKETIEIFNSLGFNDLDSISSYFNFNNKLNIEYNQVQFQSDKTSSCGKFCIYFAVQRILNFDMSYEHLQELIFDTNTEINESTVAMFCNNLDKSHDSNIF